ncbi:MAG: polysaccharide biosynthesis tyrosine autokinase [Deltaproteobacteria bacterium]|nr:polysaccharide biosynthesis tyrosine autokinase [Deltaproteobacteria bacterium]
MSKIYEALKRAEKMKAAPAPPPSPEPKVPLEIEPTPYEDLVAINKPGSLMAEYFRFLRTKILRPSTGTPPRSILVTSPLRGDGKTFVACNLAATISVSVEEYVLLIDTDLRGPQVHKVFGVESNKEGLSTHLTHGTPLPDLLKKTILDKLTILPAGNSTRIPAELLSSEKMRELMRETRNRYSDRYVIIDGPPLELAPESSVIANEVDAVIMVVRYGKTPRNAVKSALERINKEKVLGIVFNAYDEPFKGHEFYGGYYGYEKKKG